MDQQYFLQDKNGIFFHNYQSSNNNKNGGNEIMIIMEISDSCK
jgi:hypothetical protein